MKKARTYLLFGAALTGLAVGGCALTADKWRQETADRIAGPVWMIPRAIPAAPFALQAYERMHAKNAPANIYIEGDGVAWLSKTHISLDPTPSNPVALHLAAKDEAKNVAYIARPCQYTDMLGDEEPCPSDYWSVKRFAPEVLESYNLALNDIKARYHIQEFNLVGFSGGGAIAALLAAMRDDVASLRTVAGNLDHRAHSEYHDVSYLSGSLNPPEYAQSLSAVPQIHYIGGQDEIVPPAIAHSYVTALSGTQCVQVQMVQEAEHETGWVDKWPQLLAVEPECQQIGYEIDFGDLPEFEPPVYTRPETASKP